MNVTTFRTSLMQLCFLAACLLPLPAARGQAKKSDEERIYVILNRLHYTQDDEKTLVEFGRKSFPVFLKLLSDERTDGLIVERILTSLALMKEDRNIFLEPVVARLGDKHWPNRMEAAVLVGQIGSAKDAPPLVALLSDRHLGIVMRAAQALGKIGGARERLAMTIWLLNAPKDFDADTINDVRRAVDSITHRLEKKK